METTVTSAAGSGPRRRRVRRGYMLVTSGSE